MGNTTTRLPLLIVCTTPVSHSTQVENDETAVTNYVADGGCLAEFRAAMIKCDPIWDHDAAKRRVACIGATKALRECFGRNPDYFEHHYIKRLDSGLDQDVGWQEDAGKFRWWTGVRRS